MADNVLRKPASHRPSPTATATADGQMPPTRKISAPVHRTTTETIRLGEPLDNPGKNQPHHHHHHGQSLGSMPIPVGNSTPNTPNSTGAQGRTKKTSSFQITSVTVGCRMSNDAGEDSNDDLDESHTEDNSVEHSRLTDIETPSYSEDTFSKDDVFFNASNAALSTAPVIPTSSQYGLAIVPSSEANNANNAANDSNINTLDITSVTDNNIINLLSSNAKQDADLREVHSHGRNERFKVVKIESTEPFKRGRWTCMDYLDHTSVNQPTAISTPKVSDPNEVCISYGVTDTGIVIPDKQQQQQQQVVDDKGITMDANGPIHPEVPQQQQHPSVGYTVPTPQQQQQQQQVPPQYFQSSASQTQQPPAQQQQQQPGGQGTTLPTNLQPAHPSNMAQTQSMPQGTIPILTQQGCPVSQASNVAPQQQQPPQQTMAHATDETTYVTVNSQGQTMPPPQAHPQQPTTGAPPPSSQPPSIIVSQQQQQPTSQSQQPTQMPETISAMQGMQGMQSIHKVPQPGAAPPQQQQQQPQQLQPQSQVMAPSGQMQPGPTQQQQQQQQQATAAGAPQVQVVGGMQQGNIAFHQQQQQQQPAPTQQPTDSEQDSMSGMVVAGAPAGQSIAADAALLESLAEVTQNTDDHQTHEDNESMSGTSAVAIDNKIEQAMDLVKSHLMFAVREEVEVLKEKIAELMDRINQLEAENSILKARATPETLAQLSQSATKLPINNSGSGQ